MTDRWDQSSGYPSGNAQFVAEHTQKRLEEEQRLWNAIPSVQDLQCARGKFWFRAATLEPITFSERCLSVCPKSTPAATTKAKDLLKELPGSDEEN